MVAGCIGKTNSHFDSTRRGRGPHHHAEASIDGCRILFHSKVFTYCFHVPDGNTFRLTCFLSDYFSLIACVSKLFERIILSRLLFVFFGLIPFCFSARPVSALVDLLWIKFFIFLSSFRMGLTNASFTLLRFSLPLTFLKFLIPYAIPLSRELTSSNIPTWLVRGAQSFFSDGRACVVYQNHKSLSFQFRLTVPQSVFS